MSFLSHTIEVAGTQTAARRKNRSRGVVLVTIIVFIVLSLALFGLWARSVVRERDRQTMRQFRIQAERLAEAGIERARALRSANAEYREETWSVPAPELDGAHAGQVRIHVTPKPDGSAVGYEAVAEFPVGAVRHAQRTKTLELPNPGR